LLIAAYYLSGFVDLKKQRTRKMTKLLYVPLAAAAMLMPAWAAMAQDARARAVELEIDGANGVQPPAEYSASPRIIWRTPEIRPFTWEEQRVLDRSSHLFGIPRN
jgi:hypothetical protein